VREVVAAGQIDDGKTIGSPRDAILPGVIAERLREWREIAATHGLPTGPQDFIVPGRAPRHGRKHPGGHMTQSQEKRWGGKYLRPACKAAAESDTARDYLADATPYAGRRGHISSRLAAGESVPAVAESCGTSRKTITAHYHEDLGDVFERPYPRFEEQLARAQTEIAHTRTPRAPPTETLRCEAGAHDWERLKRPGSKPRSCPEHRRTRGRADVIAPAPRPGAIGASESCLEAGLTVVLARGGSVAALRFASQQFAGVCRFCVGNTGDSLAVRPQTRRPACKMPS